MFPSIRNNKPSETPNHIGMRVMGMEPQQRIVAMNTRSSPVGSSLAQQVAFMPKRYDFY